MLCLAFGEPLLGQTLTVFLVSFVKTRVKCLVHFLSFCVDQGLNDKHPSFSFICVLFWGGAVLEFEFRTLYLLGKHSSL
jgi:hypothetical protein